MKPGRQPIPLTERFWKRVKVCEPEECWPFQGYINPDTGYGMLRVNAPRRVEMAHRIAWILTYGPLTKGNWVLHRCDNPPCCNPRHLFLGDHQINMKDAKEKSRFIGRNNILSYEQVLQIHKLVGTGMRQQDIADAFGISQPNVSLIVNNKTWRTKPGQYYKAPPSQAALEAQDPQTGPTTGQT